MAAINEAQTLKVLKSGRSPYRFNGLQILLPQFEGPLELLLYLIRRNHASIYDIPIAKITEQYLDYLALMQELDIPLASEFIVMAATLLYLKSALLLPDAELDEDEGDEDEEGEKLTAEQVKAMLSKRLADYERYREAAEFLSERERWWALMFSRVNGNGDSPDNGKAVLDLGSVSMFDLLSALRDVLSRLPPEGKVMMPTRKVSLAQRIRHILRMLKAHAEGLTFAQICEDCLTRLEVIVTFLALLELIRRKLVQAQQQEPFGPILISQDAR